MSDKNQSSISKTQFMEWLPHLLCPPGYGVFTVSTGEHIKEKLFHKIFPQIKKEDQRSFWQDQLNSSFLSQEVVILGMCADNGGGIQRGANWGPLYLRDYIYKNPLHDLTSKSLQAFDLGDVRIIPHLLHDKYLNAETIQQCRNYLYPAPLNQHDLPVSPLSIAQFVASNLHAHFPGKKIFMMGGDHSVSYPFVSEFLQAKKSRGKNVAIIHFDAHTDLLPHRMGIDLCFGSWAYHILEFLNHPSQLIQIGIRATKKDRHTWENELGVIQYWPEEIKQSGPKQIAIKIIEHLKNRSIDELYISFDIDCLDEKYASATGTPEGKGLDLNAPMEIMQELYEAFPITGADLVEIAPHVQYPHLKKDSATDTLHVSSIIAEFLIGALHRDHRKQQLNLEHH